MSARLQPQEKSCPLNQGSPQYDSLTGIISNSYLLDQIHGGHTLMARCIEETKIWPDQRSYFHNTTSLAEISVNPQI